MVTVAMSGRKDAVSACSLGCMKTGGEYRVVTVLDEACREHVLRMGLSEGARLLCITNIAKGPVVVRCVRTDVAIGRGMAEKILVEPVVNRNLPVGGGTLRGILSSGTRLWHRFTAQG